MSSHAKKAVALILAKMHPAKEGAPDASRDDSDEGHEGLTSAAEDLIGAIHEKDPAGVVEALRSAFSMLDHDEESSEDQ